ncbi:DUF6891 domain-containing protein [Methanobrevibacter sp. DSM 116169]|uniref:DUF6891 domain-containing protein n=1 Tax=Methanobrevibacter sp. DSM 116169 TaxID=3242727 RepID=UPI0038FBEF48
MTDNLKEELDFTLEILTKSAFYSNKEIAEIIEEQFIDEDINLDDLDFSYKEQNNENFNKLEEVFKDLNKKNIIAIHNCGYDLEDGINDVLELYNHLKINKLNPDGFCFYTFEDVEEAILEESLFLTFADFHKNKDEALKIGQIIVDTLKDYNFNVNWNGSFDEFIEIKPFRWDKSYNDTIYEMEGAFNSFKEFHS